MYYFLYGFLYLLSLLPMRILYFLADGLYGLVYHVLRYRRRVVMQNLQAAFPDKSEAERNAIAKKFYHNFLDTFIETIKMLSCSEEFLRKRFSGNWEVVADLYDKGFSCQLHLGHNFNWEWGNAAIAAEIPHKVAVVYMPIKSKAMDRLFLKLRARAGSGMIPATPAEAYRTGLRQLREHRYALILAADQSPGDPEKAYWLNFLNQPTGFVTGPEKSARLNKLPVFFTVISKKKRGYYHAEQVLATTDPRSMKEGELTVMFARFLEDVIKKHPDNWLWSHRRWKRDWKPEYEKMWIDKESPQSVVRSPQMET